MIVRPNFDCERGSIVICRSANQNTAVQGLIGSTNAYIGLSDTAAEVIIWHNVKRIKLIYWNLKDHPFCVCFVFTNFGRNFYGWSKENCVYKQSHHRYSHYDNKQATFLWTDGSTTSSYSNWISGQPTTQDNQVIISSWPSWSPPSLRSTSPSPWLPRSTRIVSWCVPTPVL